MALAFCSGVFLAGPGNQLSALALTLDGSFYLSYYDNAAPKQMGMALDDPGTGEIFPLSSSEQQQLTIILVQGVFQFNKM